MSCLATEPDIAERSRSLVTAANEQVSIFVVCGLLHVNVPETALGQRSVKVHCPFGAVYHIDQGRDAALRIYGDTNSAYCFAERAYYNPVRLYAAAHDLDPVDAAAFLLDHVGYRSLNAVQEWERVASAADPSPGGDSLSEALKVYCTRIDGDFEDHQFDTDVAATLTRCLELLPQVTTADDAVKWLGVSKTVMARALGVSE